MVTDIAEARNANFSLLKGILNTKLEQPKPDIAKGEHPEFEELLKKDSKLKALYDGNTEIAREKSIEECAKIRKAEGRLIFPSKSEAEQSLVTKLCMEGFTDDEIKEIMQGCKIGKWQEKDESYYDATIKKGREFAAEYQRKREELKKEDYQSIKLADICADLIHKRVKVDLIVVGEQDKKAIGGIYEIKCGNCGKQITIDALENEKPQVLAGLLFGRIDQFLQKQFIKKHGEKCPAGDMGRHDLEIEIKKYMDYAVVFIREIRTKSEKFNAKVYKPRKAFLIKQPLPAEKKIRLYGWEIIEPKTHNICILATKVETLEDQLSTFEITEEDKENWCNYFKNANPESMANNIAPHIVGEARLIAKEAECLCLHSPIEIPTPDGNLIRGGLRILNFGDTKVGKSELGKGITGYGEDAYSFGEYIVGESAKRCGITYTIDTDNKAIIWGVLATNDFGLVVIDGLQSIFSDEIGELREALEQQKIIVRRSQSGEAFARTRVVACMNPREEMSNYVYPAQALQSSYPFNNPPDVTRWDIFIPFSLDDVAFDEIKC
jgi:DNA replicative helicase MCM subunit Mcm2 (Cdc46/Mcm family)